MFPFSERRLARRGPVRRDPIKHVAIKHAPLKHVLAKQGWDRRGAGAILAGALTLAALAVANAVVARRTEQRHPPTGRFLVVDGVRLHYTDQGEGSPVVLIHGNVVAGDDWDISGVAAALRENHRVIVFDRPGFGHSERPRGRAWTAGEQADLLREATLRLGVERPVIAGHSWGTLVALSWAARHPGEVAGLVLRSSAPCRCWETSCATPSRRPWAGCRCR